MNDLPSLGIIGGAGPEAGVLLFRQVIRICQKNYQCQRDYEFPLIHLVSFPFSEMLEGNPDEEMILSDVKEVYNQLQTDFVVIACNTLHVFLDDTFALPRFIHLIKETGNTLKSIPIVLCSSTSKESKIHERFFSCKYPESAMQTEVDAIINLVLERGSEESTRKRLMNVIQECRHQEVVLGCTELSLIHDENPLLLDGVTIIDPSWVVAEKICPLIFKNKRNIR